MTVAFPRPVDETLRGPDVRVYDRRAERMVWGPSHPFEEPGDLVLDNGLLRAWVGPEGLPPFLSVFALGSDDAWKHHGFLLLDAPGSSRELLSVRLVRVTPDATTACLEVTGAGEILVTLRRGERMVRVTHGSPLPPRVSAARYIQWSGVPPHTLLHPDVALADGRYGRGLADGYVRLRWPPRLSSTGWASAFWWLPDAASATQVDSGLMSISGPNAEGVNEELVRLRWLDTEDVLRLEAGGEQVDVAASWNADDQVLVVPRITSSGLELSTVVDGTAIHESTAATLSLGTFTRLRYGASGGFEPESAGDETAGDGTAGGGKLAAGLLDNVMLFAALSAAEVEALGAATDPLGGLPSPESRLVLYVPFDSTIAPVGSDLESGRRHEIEEAS